MLGELYVFWLGLFSFRTRIEKELVFLVTLADTFF